MGAELDSDLVALCQTCHSALHQFQRDHEYLVERATSEYLLLVQPSRTKTTHQRRTPSNPMSNLPPWPSIESRMKPKGKDPMAVFFARGRQ